MVNVHKRRMVMDILREGDRSREIIEKEREGERETEREGKIVRDRETTLVS